jgi:hypothetical protein
MITDTDFLQQVRDSWETVRTSQAMVDTNLRIASGLGGPQTEDFKNFSHSLIILFAFSVLEDVLEQLRSEGVFMSGRRHLDGEATPVQDDQTLDIFPPVGGGAGKGD